MIDIKAIQLRDFTKVTRVDYMDTESIKQQFDIDPGEAIPQVLVVEGEHFDRAEDVWVNGTSVNYQLISSTKLFATLPSSIENQPITSIHVLTDKEDFSIASMFDFKFGSRPGPMRGQDKCIAQFIKVLMTTPGSDSFDKQLGGGIQKLPGSNVQGAHTLLARVASTVLRVAEQIRSRNEGLDLPNDERLHSVNILGLDFKRGDPTSVEVRLTINTFSVLGVPVSFQMGNPARLPA